MFNVSSNNSSIRLKLEATLNIRDFLMLYYYCALGTKCVSDTGLFYQCDTNPRPWRN